MPQSVPAKVTPIDPEGRSVELWRRRSTWLVIVGIATLFALADAAQTSLILRQVGRPPVWGLMALRDLTFWLTFVAWMPAVLFLADRFRLTWPLSWRRVMIHLVGGYGFAVVHIATTSWLDPMRSREPGAFQQLFSQWIMRHSAQDVLAYWAVVGAFYTIDYYRESRQREVTAARLEMSLSEARLQALRAQFNPHFLFNTLNTIAVLVRKGEQAAVAAVLGRLSTLLRASLGDTCAQEITLAEELEFLDGYLEIQEFRFADSLRVHRRIESETVDALVPSMILQPLVENAVVHGISTRPGGGHITIESRRDGELLRLCVSDSGPGFGARPVLRSRQGLGLANTQARLVQLYGAHQRIVCGESPDAGAMVTVVIPFRTSSALQRSSVDRRS